MPLKALAAPGVVLLDVALVALFALVGLPGYAILSAVLGLFVVLPTLALTDYAPLRRGAAPRGVPRSGHRGRRRRPSLRTRTRRSRD